MLPPGGFQWVDTKDCSWYTRPDDDQRGVILEVDMEYPDEIHDVHNDLPLAPKSTEVTEDMLSPYCKDRWSISATAQLDDGKTINGRSGT